MISKIVVHHPGAQANAPHTIFFGTVFNVREISTRLAEKPKTKPACLRVFETSEAAWNFSCDVESLVDICGAIFTDRKASSDLLKLDGGFSFDNEGDSTVIVYLRVDEVVQNHQDEVIEGRGDASVSAGNSSGVEIRDDNKGRKRTTPQVMAILHAATFVWPRNSNGIPLPCYNQQHSVIPCEHAASPSPIRSKLNWVDAYVLSIYKHLENESNTPLAEIHDGVW